MTSNSTPQAPRLGRNFIILSIGEAFSKLLTFLAFAFLARVLGPESFGTIEFALAIIFVFSQIVDLGTEKIGAVMAARAKENISRLLVHVVSLRVLSSIAAFAILLTLVAFLNQPWTIKQIILLYGLSLFFVPGLLQWLFQGLEKMLWVACFSILRQLVFAAAVFLWIREPEQIWMVALFEVTAVLSVVMFNFIVFHRQFGKPKFQFDPSYAKSIVKQSLPMFLSQLMMALKLQLPAILLGVLLLSNQEVAWFRASHRIVLAINTFAMLYLFNLLPSISRCYSSKRDELKQLMNNSMRVALWPTIFIGLVGLVFSGPIISGIYGSRYANAATMFSIMVWLIALTMISGHYRSMLFGLSQQKLDFVCTGSGAVVTAMLCMLLIPKYAAVGAAWAMIAAEVLTLALAYYFSAKKIVHVPIVNHLIKPIFAATLTIAGLKFFPTADLLATGALSAFLFLAAMQLLQPTILSDIRSLAVGIK